MSSWATYSYIHNSGTCPVYKLNIIDFAIDKLLIIINNVVLLVPSLTGFKIHVMVGTCTSSD